MTMLITLGSRVHEPTRRETVFRAQHPQPTRIANHSALHVTDAERPANTTAWMTVLRRRLAAGSLSGRVARGAVQTVLVSTFGAAASFALMLGLARLLGQDAFGTYLLALGVFNIALLVAKLELDTLSVRFVGSYGGTGKWGLLRGYLRFSRSTVLLTSFGIGLLGVLVITLFPSVITEKHPYFHASLLVACAMLPVMSLLMLEASTLQGSQQYARAQIPLNLIRPVMFGVVVVILWLFRPSSLSAPAAVAANLCGALTALAFAWTWRRRATPRDLRVAAPERDVPLWMRTSFPLLAVSLAQTILSQQTDVIVVGTFMSSADVAVYGAASQLTLPLMLAATSVTFVAQPMIADLYSRDPARLQSLVRFVTW